MNVRRLALIAVVCACLAFAASCAPAPQAAPPTATPVPPAPTPIPPSPTPAPPTPTPEPAPTAATAAIPVPDILKAYQDAFNEGNADAVLALFVDEGMNYIDLHGIDTSDKRSMRDYIEMQMAAGGVVKIQDCKLDGDKYACTLLAHDDCARAWGIVDMHNDLQVELEDGKIKIMSIAIDPVEWRTWWEKQVEPIEAWMKANRADDWAKITSGVNSREVGKLQSEGCKAYIAAQK